MVYCAAQALDALDDRQENIMPVATQPFPTDLARSECITLKEAAELLGVASVNPVLRLAERGQLTIYSPVLGTARLVRRADVERLTA
ncbi:hypothetical protein BW737_008750 [Actinomyces ruminis]|uniref:Helix-turn-helix domain-containing protein n=2 Tax=Actinomyces ruminis TaxID=1937003 RepID=A0ABX4MAS8_9ACTO|nr:hypothetical protein BW737_008750 [Actinomyces ruminis]